MYAVRIFQNLTDAARILRKSSEESARDDANRETNSKLYLIRLKLRGAEQVLPHDMKFNSRQDALLVAWEEDNTETIVIDSASH